MIAHSFKVFFAHVGSLHTRISRLFIGQVDHVAGYESPLQPTGLLTTNWVIIYKPVPFKLQQDWCERMMNMVRAGIVLRKVRNKDSSEKQKYHWVPGFLFKRDSKWTWKAIPPEIADRFSLNMPPVSLNSLHED